MSDQNLSSPDVSAAKRAVMDRYRQTVDEYLNIQSRITVLNQRSEQLLAIATDCFAAARVLRFGEDEFSLVWQSAAEAAQKQTALSLPNVSAIASASVEPTLATVQASPVDIPTPSPPGATPTSLVVQSIKDRVLAAAEKAYPNPIKVTELRQQFGQAGISLHEKTIGMTLYRWLKEGRVRRSGRNWFFIPKSNGVPQNSEA